MKFNEKLQLLRKEKGYSQEQLADLLDVSRQSVSKWELGTTYPEMDKLLMICKIFNVTLDDLTNDEVDKSALKEKSRNNFNDLLYTMLEMINKSIEMFKNMSKKNLVRTISELLILFLILLIMKIPFNYIINLAEDVFINLGNAYSIINSMFVFVINIIYLILFVTIFIFVFKTKYLDQYEYIQKEGAEEICEIHEKKEDKKKTEKIEKVVVKREHRFIIFDVLGKCFNFFFKLCLFFIVLLTGLVFIAFIFCLTISIIVNLNGIIFIGIIIVCLGLVLGSGVILDLGIGWLFSKENRYKVLLIAFITSLVFLGIGGAITAYEITTYEYINNLSDVTNQRKDIYYLDMNDNLLLNDGWYNYEYIVNEEYTKDIKITIQYYDEFMNVSLNQYQNNIEIHWYENESIIKNIYTLIISNLKNKKIYNYNDLQNINLIVETSQENIQKLNDNYYKYLEESREESINDMQNYYEKIISELYEEKTALGVKISEYENTIYNLEQEIENYKNNLKSIIEE